MPDTVSPRYATIVAILNDPMNHAVIEREMARRAKGRTPGLGTDKGYAPPPIKKRDGGMVVLTMRAYQRVGPGKTLDEKANGLDYLADIYFAGDGWFVVLQDGEEVGPFDDLSTATKEALMLLTQEGYLVLPESPWTKADVEAFPL